MQRSTKFISIILIFAMLLASCSSNNKLNKEEQKLLGFWYHGIRPGAFGFFPDKTYIRYGPNLNPEFSSLDTGEVAMRGTWKLENHQLTLWTEGEEEADIQKIVWENDSTFSFGSFEDADRKEFSTKDDFMSEYGMYRAK